MRKNVKHVFSMRKKMYLFAWVLIVSSLFICQAISETVYWINPDGGTRYHLDRNCPSINPKYLPLLVQLTEEELNQSPYDQMMACSVCVPSADIVSRTETQQEGVLEQLNQYPEEPVLSSMIEVVWHDVNFRKEPGGKVITRIQGGEVLECLGETWYKGNMWYHAYSEQYGDGYIKGTLAKPVWNNEYYWQRMSPDDEISDQDFITVNMLKHFQETLQFQLDCGFIRIGENEEDGLFAYNVTASGNVRHYDTSIATQEMKIELTLMLYKNGMICLDSQYDQLKSPETLSAEKNQIAASILQNHYGTDDLWQIFLLYAGGFHPSDWHSLATPSSKDMAAEQAVITDFVARNR